MTIAIWMTIVMMMFLLMIMMMMVMMMILTRVGTDSTAHSCSCLG